MTTHAYRQTKELRIGNIVTTLLTFLFVVVACAQPATPVPTPTCLPESEEDPSAPSVMMVVYYRIDGTQTARTVSEFDRNVMIHVDNANDVRIVYMGSDCEGMKKLQPAVQVVRVADGINQMENWSIQATVTTCPRGELQDQITFEQVGSGATIKTMVTATNWHGLQTSIQRITITGSS